MNWINALMFVCGLFGCCAGIYIVWQCVKSRDPGVRVALPSGVFFIIVGLGLMAAATELFA